MLLTCNFYWSQNIYKCRLPKIHYIFFFSFADLIFLGGFSFSRKNSRGGWRGTGALKRMYFFLFGDPAGDLRERVCLCEEPLLFINLFYFCGMEQQKKKFFLWSTESTGRKKDWMSTSDSLYLFSRESFPNIFLFSSFCFLPLDIVFLVEQSSVANYIFFSVVFPVALVRWIRSQNESVRECVRTIKVLLGLNE